MIAEYRNGTLEAAKEYNSNLFNPVKKYSYDGRGNLTQILQGETPQRQFEFDGTNQLRAAFELQRDITRAAKYTYNGLGQRVGQDTYTQQLKDCLQPLSKIDFAKMQPENQFCYLLDITKDYNNLLERTDAVSGKRQQFLWDTNVISMQEAGEDSFYLQDAQGSVMSLTDRLGNSLERYEFDEFGLPLGDTFISSRQPFAFAGYQMDAVGGMYFAQARRYDASVGRFISEDKIRGTIAAPFTMNHYGYCWNRPVDFVDLDGLMPQWLENIIKGIEAHTLLQQQYMKDYGSSGGRKEYLITSGVDRNKTGAGRADIVYFNGSTKTVEVYEIKPSSYAPGTVRNVLGLAQLDSYISALRKNGQIKNGWNIDRGNSLNGYFSSISIPSKKFKGEEIVYKVYENGMIIYEYTGGDGQGEPETEPVPSKVEEESKNMVECGILLDAAAISAIAGLILYADNIPTAGAGVADDWLATILMELAIACWALVFPGNNNNDNYPDLEGE